MTGSWQSVALSPAPYHLSVISSAGGLYVSSREDSVVWVIDMATLETRAEIAIPGVGHQFAQAPGGCLDSQTECDTGDIRDRHGKELQPPLA